MTKKRILKIPLLIINALLFFIALHFKNSFFAVSALVFFIYFLWLFHKWKKIKTTDNFKLKTLASTDIILFFILILGLRLIKIQIIDVDKYRKVVNEQIEGYYELKGKRGKILDRNGTELAYSLKTYNLYLDPKRVISNPPSKKAIGEIFETFKINKNYNYFMKTVLKDGKNGRRYKNITKGLNENEKIKLDKILKKYKIYRNEIFIKENSVRKYYNINNYQETIGRLGYSNKSGKYIGVFGLEKYYNSYLNEKKIIKKSIFAKNRKLILPMAKEEMNINLDGKSLFLTIDNDIQYILNDEMRKKFKETKSEEAYAIIINPNNGEILALSNLRKNMKVLRNGVFQNQLEPGSIFKPIVMSAALNDGFINKKSKFDIKDGKITKYNHTIKEASRSTKGVLTLKEILAKSSNVAMVMISDLFSNEKMEEYLINYGLYNKTNVDFPFEKKPYTTPSYKWDGLKKNTIAFGQGVAVTPVQMVTAFSAIVNGGTLYRPFLVKKIVDEDGIVIRRNLPKVIGHPISEETSTYMRELLENVVNNGGGKHAKLNGYRIGGKTGTAQISGGKSGYIKKDFLTSFVGVFPANKPEYVAFITFYKPEVEKKYGGIVAAPVFKEVVKRITMKKEILSNQIEKIKINKTNFPSLIEHKKIDIVSMPNLKGLTAREAIILFESKDIDFDIKGTGLIEDFYPKEGTNLKDTKTIHLILGGKK
ncbi:penicillin-binding transpeptidase domain-containing protein [Fusobacterium sp. IOR10]|uniref:penicillin-binding transpeptidase domain-containing protein n=1 Tax=Fusobacterium sp. IOR10 TaxID=2665157 RepID=UPI0013D6D76E|nr:penicillin-binding transpeptidase domain-containing protein [Fusobacterium sp. IOR10]